MSRLAWILRTVRRLVALALFAWAAWELVRPARRPRLVAVDAETGERYGFRISPLEPPELIAAAMRERRLHGLEGGIDSGS